MRLPQYARARACRLPVRRLRALGRPAVALSGAVLLLGSLAACTTGSSGAPNTTATGTPTTSAATATTPTDGTGTATGSDQSSTAAQTSSAPSSSQPSSGAPATGSATKTVPVQITIHDWNAKAGQAEVDAFVPGVVISGGTCTLTLTSGSTIRTATHPAVTTPTSTSCGLMSIPHDQLSAGTWRAIVSFRASNAVGRSDSVSIQVPA